MVFNFFKKELLHNCFPCIFLSTFFRPHSDVFLRNPVRRNSRTPEDEINDTSFYLKQNVSQTETNWRFQKNVKNISTKQESGATFQAWLFSFVFNFGCKDGRVTTATCKYCLLVVSSSDEALRKFLPLPIVAKNSILNVAEFLDPPLKTSPCMKTSLVSCEASLFS